MKSFSIYHAIVILSIIFLISIGIKSVQASSSIEVQENRIVYVGGNVYYLDNENHNRGWTDFEFKYNRKELDGVLAEFSKKHKIFSIIGITDYDITHITIFAEN